MRPESVGPNPEDVTIHDGRANDDIDDLPHSLRERGFAFVRGVPTTLPFTDFGKHFVHKPLKALIQLYGFRDGGTALEPITEPQINGRPPPAELQESAAKVAEYYRETLPAVQRALPNLEAAIGFNQVARSTRAPPINMKTFNAFDGNIDPPAGNSIHTDNSPKQGLQAVKDMYNGYARKLKLQGNRYEVYWLNLWRNVDPENPIQNQHLAILDRSSLKHSDVNFTMLNFDGITFEQMLLSRHEPHHRWTYFSDMKMDEILIFPQAKGIMERDSPGSEWRFSQPDSDHPEGTMHMAVADPRCPDGERHSQENRFCAFVRLDGAESDEARVAGLAASTQSKL